MQKAEDRHRVAEPAHQSSDETAGRGQRESRHPEWSKHNLNKLHLHCTDSTAKEDPGCDYIKRTGQGERELLLPAVEIRMVVLFGIHACPCSIKWCPTGSEAHSFTKASLVHWKSRLAKIH